MIKTLVSLNADLASSIGLRYTCQLAGMIEMDLETIHVEETDQEGHPPGTGWVRRTWEKGLLETAQEEISQLINAERGSYPTLKPPKMFVGDHDTEILRELEEGAYDLFVEGVLYSFNSSGFYRKIRSRLYRQAPCSIILVKNLVSLKRIILLLGEEIELQSVIPTFLKIFAGAEVEVDLLRFEFQHTGRLSFKKKAKVTPSFPKEDSDRILDAASELLASGGRVPKEKRIIKGTPVNIGDSLSDHGLVMSCLPHQVDKKSPLLELLSRVPSAIFLCWQ